MSIEDLLQAWLGCREGGGCWCMLPGLPAWQLGPSHEVGRWSTPDLQAERHPPFIPPLQYYESCCEPGICPARRAPHASLSRLGGCCTPQAPGNCTATMPPLPASSGRKAALLTLACVLLLGGGGPLGRSPPGLQGAAAQAPPRPAAAAPPAFVGDAQQLPDLQATGFLTPSEAEQLLPTEVC